MRSTSLAAFCYHLGWITVGAHTAFGFSHQSQQWKSASSTNAESVFAQFPIEQRMRDYNITGVGIAFIQNNTINWTKSYGFADREAKRPVEASTMFQSASISKPIAVFAALHYVERGNLSLDQNINRHLKDWQIPENQFTTDQKVTLRRLASHTAGLTVRTFPGYAKDEVVPDLIQILDGVQPPASTPPIRVDIVPGTKTRYSGGGTTVIQKALIDLLEKPFPEIMSETVLSTLRMENSTYENPLPAAFFPHAATAYRGAGKPVTGLWHTYPEMAAAGLWSTPADLARFAIEIQLSLQGKSNKIISQNMTEQMLTKQLDEFGLGPELRGQNESLVFLHTGLNEGFRCIMLALAHRPDGIVIMTNSDNGMDFISELVQNVSTAYGWPYGEWYPVTPSPGRETTPKPSSPASSVRSGTQVVALGLLFFLLCS